jgi:hypothetical protein
MVQVLTTQYHSLDPLVEVMVFTRQSASATWFLSFDTGYTGGGKILLFAHPDNSSAFESQPRTDPSLNTTALPGMLAAYWQHWKDTGTAPAPTALSPGPITSGHGQDVANSRADYRTAGIDQRTTFSADPGRDGVWSFAVNADRTQSLDTDEVLTCGTVRYRSVFTPLAPATAVTQSKTHDPFGTLLDAGQYSSVTESGLHETCFSTQPGQTTIVEGIGYMGEQTRIVGIPINGGTAA